MRPHALSCWRTPPRAAAHRAPFLNSLPPHLCHRWGHSHHRPAGRPACGWLWAPCCPPCRGSAARSSRSLQGGGSIVWARACIDACAGVPVEAQPIRACMHGHQQTSSTSRGPMHDAGLHHAHHTHRPPHSTHTATTHCAGPSCPSRRCGARGGSARRPGPARRVVRMVRGGRGHVCVWCVCGAAC